MIDTITGAIRDSYFVVMFGVFVGFGISALPIMIWRSLKTIEHWLKRWYGNEGIRRQ
ncbi:hypothetical protein LCGC14_0781860 [marine sediment metagenome]|uniref:Uncharacterized protein n=1 Tax=marine sediment metagenome TaxID=412755 RepID=A0A0F9PZJ4_9ZZZZ